MSAEVKAFYYPESMADESTVAKAILLFDELHFMDRASRAKVPRVRGPSESFH